MTTAPPPPDAVTSSFPSPFEVAIPAGAEGWEEMYAYHTLFADERIGCVCGELVLELPDGGGSGEGLYWKYETLLKRMESRLGFLLGATGGIFAIRRSLFRPLPPTTIVEDFVTAMKILEAGHQVCYEPKARATESTIQSPTAITMATPMPTARPPLRGDTSAKGMATSAMIRCTSGKESLE